MCVLLITHLVRLVFWWCFCVVTLRFDCSVAFSHECIRSLPFSLGIFYAFSLDKLYSPSKHQVYNAVLCQTEAKINFQIKLIHDTLEYYYISDYNGIFGNGSFIVFSLIVVLLLDHSLANKCNFHRL